ncbi:hypothetical protein [Geodermatophilus sp. FMUSA9-8]|uniref:hypothetical protein n=1 Tax=Geodermatophilus sp. FMUSA9-8 TaxID=3120155 RepID=UPI00300A638E
MTTASSQAFLTRIARLRELDRASFDDQVLAGQPLWLGLAVTEASKAEIAGTERAQAALSCGNDEARRSPQVPH